MKFNYIGTSLLEAIIAIKQAIPLFWLSMKNGGNIQISIIIEEIKP